VSLVSTERLAEQIGSDIVVLDASYHLPDTGRDAAAEYAKGHLPGALFLDLASLVDPASPIDNTLPSHDLFARRMGELGIGNDSRVVLYDDSAIKSATRAWYLLKLFGASHVAVLDGGLGKWEAEDRPLSKEVTLPETASFAAAPDESKLRTKADIFANLDKRHEQVVDARGVGRFTGEDRETREGLEAGHIPGSRNVHYALLFGEDGTFRSVDELREIFAAADVDPAASIIATCGSGITACALAFALHLIGQDDVALYDGSWCEWGADPKMPKAVGPA
jgi:thiosulfate/3-mercaptopyruvate sulfurtransferase